jgi:hypothetical protein
MSVTVDDQTLQAEQLGLRTVGQLLAHLQKDNRLVLHLLIDGEEPDLEQLASVRQAPLEGHTLYIETALPQQVAGDVMDELAVQLTEADQLKAEAADLLQKNQCAAAMEKLSGCFVRWQHVQQSILKTAELLRIDLAAIHVGQRSLEELFATFTEQLRGIRTALADRDFVTLGDILLYETADTTAQWQQAIAAVRVAVR